MNRESGVGECRWYYLISRGIVVELIKGSTRAQRRMVFYQRRDIPIQAVRVALGNDGEIPGVREGVKHAANTTDNPAGPTT